MFRRNLSSQIDKRKRFSYFPSVSEDIKQVFKGKNEHLELAFKPMNQLGHTVFTKLKQKIEKTNQINTVYKIPCAGKENEPCSKSYIGHSKRRLRERMYEHKSSNNHVNNGIDSDQPIHNDDNNDKTALVIHAETTKHQPDFDNISIVDTEQYYSRRLIAESLHIYCNDTMNLRRDVQGISKSYASILQTVKNRNSTTTLRK